MFSWESYLRIFTLLTAPFLLHIVPPTLLFCLPCKRRSRFGIKAAVALVLLVAYGMFVTLISFGIPRLDITGMPGFLMYILLLAGVLAAEKLLFKSSLSSLLFNLLAGLALYQICLFVFCIFYPAELNAKWPARSIEYNVILTVWLAVAYAASYMAFIRRQDASAEDITSRNYELYLSIGISLFLIYFNLIRTSKVEAQSIVDYVCLVCLILFYMLILFLRKGLLSVIRTEKELILMQRIWKEKEKSLKLTAEAANAISIKYHDLKHLLTMLKNEDSVELVNEIADSLKVYEHVISTGNDALDMVLTEKTLLFNRGNVEFTYIVDGGAIAFMRSLDIISLFSNALDNAYEAVLPLSTEKREIYLSVKQVIGMISICVENPYCATLDIQHGIPVTSKQDKRFHGFGIKSISTTVEKYGGTLTITADNNWFVLKVLIPGAE